MSPDLWTAAGLADIATAEFANLGRDNARELGTAVIGAYEGPAPPANTPCATRTSSPASAATYTDVGARAREAGAPLVPQPVEMRSIRDQSGISDSRLTRRW